jgi:hypothetical protein
MTQDEIMEMAKNTGVLAGYEGEPSLLIIFAKSIIEVERKACETICDDLWGSNGEIYDAVEAIRARQ